MSSIVRGRKWRRRGRRGQVAAVATLLGLLLVVTFIANFLTTVVPNQMEVNDLNHEVAVENQFGRLAALLASAGEDGRPGMQIVQPVTLGSDSVAPWVSADGSAVGGGRLGSNLTLSYGILGSIVYGPPLGYPQGGPPLPGACSFTSGAHVGITCGGGAGTVKYNFSGNSKTFSVNAVGGVTLFAFNFSTNNSHIYVNATGGATSVIHLFGSNDVMTFAMNGGATTNVTIVGNNDLVNLGQTGGGVVTVYLFGSHDTVYQAATGGALVKVVIYGSQDLFSGNATGGATFVSYVTGFNATNPSSNQCPYDNLSSTDHLAGSGVGGTTYTASFNNTAYNGSGSQGSWTINYHHVGFSSCPFFNSQAVQLGGQSLSAGGVLQTFSNLYAPSGEVAYDEGAVVYAQYGALPVIIDPPSISLTVVNSNVTAASIWVPYFTGRIGSVAGLGTETLDLRMVATNTFSTSATATLYAINPNVPIKLIVHTPYAEAWDAYLNAHIEFSGLWSCAPVAVCTETYLQGGPIGVVTITIPATNLQSLEVGNSVFAVSLA